MPTPPSGLLRDGRPLKRWCYVAFLSEPLMACAAAVHIGPVPLGFWAVWDRRQGSFCQGEARLVRRGLRVTPHEVTIPPAGLRVELEPERVAAVEVCAAHGRGMVWTRKRAGVPARAGRVAGYAVIDETIGHHARETEWWWAAGIGEAANGAVLGFNLVSGINDAAAGSERAVWIDGVPRETPPVSFAASLRSVRGSDGTRLEFAPGPERRRRERMGPLWSEYRAPFGTFSGVLAGGVALRHGLGVCEHHRARW